MKVLVACEFSGVVRNAFCEIGCDAWSCDLEDSLTPGNHIKKDVLSVVDDGWDLMIAHPPCTYLCVSGSRWWKNKRKEQLDAIDFFLKLYNANIPMVCVENPIGLMSTVFRKPDQIIQPWMFGHGETKATCLWLKNLPLLQPTKFVDGRLERVHRGLYNNHLTRSQNRSITYNGIALAMSSQWGY